MDLLNNKNKKSKSQFTILNQDPTAGHGGFGVGTLNLNDISPVIIDVENETAFVDMGALHARSEVEKRVKFTPNKEEVPEGGRPYWVVWVAVGRNDQGPYYAGVAACEMIVNKEARRGYKNLAEHVNNMDKALKHKIVVKHMDDKSKRTLKTFLQNHNQEMWERSSQQLKEDLAT